MTGSDRFESIWSDLQGVAFEQGYLDAAGVRTRYLRAGDPGLPTLVLLHGPAGYAHHSRAGGHACSRSIVSLPPACPTT